LRAAGLDPERANKLLGGGADLAVGNMLGSNVFNLMLVAVMDLVHREGALLYRLSQKHIMAASSGLGMLGLCVFGLAFGRSSGVTIPGVDVGLITPFLLVSYLVAVALQGRLEKRKDNGEQEPADESTTDARLVSMPKLRFYGTLMGLAAVIVLCGVWLSMLGDRMALPREQGGLGLGQSFVGTFFLAISTSLPELVICIGCVRLGSLNMAVGNIFGSNMFNLVILFTADVGLRGASLLRCASLSHLVTVAMVMMLTSIAVVSLQYRSRRHFANLGFDAWLMVLLYVAGNVAIYLMGR